MSIIDNRKAFFDYFIEERHEAGLVLEGWEVKAMRAGRANIKESYVMIKGGELYLIGTHISPLPEASTHIQPDPTRIRKLL
ncbi:MAG TPA: SsrA-binding protein, partial [Paraburkholderia sp.]|uniref:SsrA-binding protein n=1 Tax=Paraburkholderia sp. TaxID=1926495 RepID=UPI002CF6A8DA